MVKATKKYILFINALKGVAIQKGVANQKGGAIQKGITIQKNSAIHKISNSYGLNALLVYVLNNSNRE